MNPSDNPAQAYIGLGSNLARPDAQVRAATEALAALSLTVVEACSALYRSAPVGLTAQPDFINAVCRLRTGLPAADLMRALLAIETEHGRVRREPGGPRTLDLDLLVYVSPAGVVERRDEPGLCLPHPRMHARAFVLYPLRELAPDLVLPGHGRVADLAAACAGQVIERLHSG